MIAQAFATLGCLAPGRVILGVGSGESMNEVPLGHDWPDGKERFARLKEAVALIQALWAGERVTFDGTYYQTDARDDLRPTRPAGADLHRRVRPVRDPAHRSSRRRVHHHQRQEPRALHRDAAPRAGRGSGQGGPHRRRPRPHDRGQGVVRHRRGDRALEDTRFWGALALSPEEKTGVEDPIEMERLADALPVERVATSGSSGPTRRSTSSGSGSTSTWASGIWCSTRQDRTSAASWTSTAVTCSRAFATEAPRCPESPCDQSVRGRGGPGRARPAT